MTSEPTRYQNRAVPPSAHWKDDPPHDVDEFCDDCIVPFTEANTALAAVEQRSPAHAAIQANIDLTNTLAAEKERVVRLVGPNERRAAEAILDRPHADPDDDAAIVARALLRLANPDAEPQPTYTEVERLDTSGNRANGVAAEPKP